MFSGYINSQSQKGLDSRISPLHTSTFTHIGNKFGNGGINILKWKQYYIYILKGKCFFANTAKIIPQILFQTHFHHHCRNLKCPHHSLVQLLELGTQKKPQDCSGIALHASLKTAASFRNPPPHGVVYSMLTIKISLLCSTDCQRTLKERQDFLWYMRAHDESEK